MDKFFPAIGGLIGGYTLAHVPAMPALDPLLHIIGVITMFVFAGVLIVRGIRSLL